MIPAETPKFLVISKKMIMAPSPSFRIIQKQILVPEKRKKQHRKNSRIPLEAKDMLLKGRPSPFVPDPDPNVARGEERMQNGHPMPS
jgi:hypothetical protein